MTEPPAAGEVEKGRESAGGRAAARYLVAKLPTPLARLTAQLLGKLRWPAPEGAGEALPAIPLPQCAPPRVDVGAGFLVGYRRTLTAATGTAPATGRPGATPRPAQ